MNPQFHEEFLRLCALFYSDEISDEEWALLQVHMAYCAPCERRFLEYKQLAADVIPVLAAAAAAAEPLPPESAASLRDAEQRLMTSLDGGAEEQKRPVRKAAPFGTWGLSLAGCLLVCVAFASIYHLRARTHTTEVTSIPQVGKESDSPRTSVSAPNPVVNSNQTEVQDLRRQVSATALKLQQSDVLIEKLRDQVRKEQAQHDELSTQRDSLSSQLASAQTETQALRAQLASSQEGSAQMVARVASLETKVRLLNASLEDANEAVNARERMLALDKDFLAHDRDIRDLIGARELYIADIYDTTETGKTAKPFGRLFYTHDRSLVFYGFDLEKQQGLKQEAVFQVWGSGSDQRPVSLGLLYQEENHKRWVMRFDDAKTLARLNMVFVTVEPAGGSKKPTGKQLLRSYLQLQPNHP